MKHPLASSMSRKRLRSTSDGHFRLDPAGTEQSSFSMFPRATVLAGRIMKASGIISLCVLCLLSLLLQSRFSQQAPDVNHRQAKTSDQVKSALPMLRVANANDLLTKLRSANLWEIEETAQIPPLVFSNMPEDLHNLDVPTKKKAFLNAMLPITLIALEEIRQEREALDTILGKLEQSDDLLSFDDEFMWPAQMSDEEIELIEHLSRKYRTTSKSKLSNRVNLVPVSLVLAQGAIESSWGSSRFCREGNNLFGIWTWGNKGITPLQREEGATHKVAMYETLLDSVRAYLLMLNRLPAYADFRELRCRTDSSLDLAQGLLYYSQRRNSYIEDLKQVIVMNELQKFDRMTLSSGSTSFVPSSATVFSSSTGNAV